ncbi:MmgE/PrpD family protein [Streptosporangium sp. DT93]|uniref:MmgE/PrpD family protein n=1 Tax=Streptosporangium sp. DT93 TaxID=3393428 RepID=UPI003CF73377
MADEPMTRRIARFATSARFEDVPADVRDTLKIRLLDALGCAIGALDGPPIAILREDLAEFGGPPLVSLIGGGRTSPYEAALYNGALVRYLDFNDSYIAPGETFHPSDNIGAVLAAAEYRDLPGSELLTAIGVAYQVQCRLGEEGAVRWRHFDHTTHAGYAAGAGVSRALRLDVDQASHALAMAGTALNALRVTRTALSHWKGLAYPYAAAATTHLAFLAARGLTGPLGALDGRKGLMEAVSGRFEVDWENEGFDRIRRTFVKRFNAEVHSQSALEAALELRAEHGLHGADIASVELDTFDVAYDIIGGGSDGDKTRITTKEEADHSLLYLLAVGLLDGQVLPAQYAPERIVADDVQSLLGRVQIRAESGYTERFPEELGCRLRIRLNDGTVLEREKRDYAGHWRRPADWTSALAKFTSLTERFLTPRLRDEIAECVRNVDERPTSALTDLLRQVSGDAKADDRSS